MVQDVHISSRKDDHLRLAQQFYVHNVQALSNHDEIDAMQFVHQALPEMSRERVSASTSFAGISLPRPYFINAMTGGTELTNRVNYRLARVAHDTQSALALGSMSIAVKDPRTRDAYRQLRDDFPDVRFIANLGAEHTVESAQLVQEVIGAVALQIHLNAVQEIVMPEGEKDFTGWMNNIRAIVQESHVPVIVKEVGFGMSYETVQQLLNIGVHTVDIAGRGGTNFAQIENARNNKQDFNYMENWGLSTIRSLIEAVEARKNQGVDAHDVSIIASGGVRGPLDIVKYCALGADAVGLSGAFLQAITSSDDDNEAVESTIELIHDWDEHITNIMTILGVENLEQLRTQARYTLPESLISYRRQRAQMWK
ncbi:type 2 isopentenyl-diphosphate Delta-isomerase [Alloscardovia theropitheci]|nr:type 2 isopentenyl-diphosphate Delta-isomerase [Alloscardovia theropitheci]